MQRGYPKEAPFVRTCAAKPSRYAREHEHQPPTREDSAMNPPRFTIGDGFRLMLGAFFAQVFLAVLVVIVLLALARLGAVDADQLQAWSTR